MRQLRSPVLRAIGFGVLLGAAVPAAGQSRPLDLVPMGEARVLPERVLGASAEPFWDNFIRDPSKVAAVRSLHLAKAAWKNNFSTLTIITLPLCCLVPGR